MNMSKKLLVGTIASALIGGSAFALSERTTSNIDLGMKAGKQAAISSLLLRAEGTSGAVSAVNFINDDQITVGTVTIADDDSATLTTTIAYTDTQTNNVLASVSFTASYATGTVFDADDFYMVCTYTAGGEIESSVAGVTNSSSFDINLLRAYMSNNHNCDPA